MRNEIQSECLAEIDFILETNLGQEPAYEGGIFKFESPEAKTLIEVYLEIYIQEALDLSDMLMGCR
jgi:hypothetical protein